LAFNYSQSSSEGIGYRIPIKFLGGVFEKGDLVKDALALIKDERHFNRASSLIFPHLAQFGEIRPPEHKLASKHLVTVILLIYLDAHK